MRSLIGKLLCGSYRIEGALSLSHRERVFVGSRLDLNRRVSIKLINPGMVASRSRRKAFLATASTYTKLNHPAIAALIDYGDSEMGPFVIREFVEGVPLSQAIGNAISPTRVLAIAEELLLAVDAAHRKGLVHGDLRPANVVLNAGNGAVERVVLLEGLPITATFTDGREGHDEDWGLASDVRYGSPCYLAPEQIRCEGIDPRTDVYAFGALLFAMMTGRPPFIGRSTFDIFAHHLYAPVPRVAAVSLGNDFPPELESMVRVCLQKNPEDRYQSVADLLSDLLTLRPVCLGHRSTSRPGASASDDVNPRRTPVDHHPSDLLGIGL